MIMEEKTMIPPNETILALITPYLEQIRQCIGLAWQDYNAECEGIRHKTTATTRAAIVRDNMVYHVKRLFSDIQGVDCFQRGQLFLLIIGNQVCIKFKKLGGNMKPRYIPTQQALSYMEQVEIPGIPQASRWVAGYRLDELQTGIKNILLIYPMGAKSIPWYLELTPTINTIFTPSKEESEDRRKAHGQS
jgi:hypothetical protein